MGGGDIAIIATSSRSRSLRDLRDLDLDPSSTIYTVLSQQQRILIEHSLFSFNSYVIGRILMEHSKFDGLSTGSYSHIMVSN